MPSYFSLCQIVLTVGCFDCACNMITQRRPANFYLHMNERLVMTARFVYGLFAKVLQVYF